MPAPAQHMATQCEPTQVSAKPFSHKRATDTSNTHHHSLSGYRSWAIAHAGLTFGEGLQLLAKLEVELLQCRALADGCKIKCRSVVRSIRGTRLTFRQGLYLTARQVELCEGGDTAEHGVGLLCTIQRCPAQCQLLQLQFSERCHSPNQPTEAFALQMLEGDIHFLGGNGD